MRISIEKLLFDFDDAWTVFQYDAEKDLLPLKQAVNGTKDVDIIAVKGGALWLLEVTDLRGARIENRKKMRHGGMIQEFAQKIRDTIPAMVGAFHSTAHSEKWDQVMERLASREPPIRVILWIEQDAPGNLFEEKRRKVEMDTFMKGLKKHLKWLTSRVLVESRQTYENRLGGLTVSCGVPPRRP